jgi:hypothetical protein
LTVLAVTAARGAFFYVFFIPAGALILLSWAVTFNGARRVLVPLGVISAAAAVALLVAGWGIPLSVAQTERAVARTHPNFRQPIRCHPVAGGGMLAQRYDCSWRGSIGSMGFDVNDSEIVAEYP